MGTMFNNSQYYMVLLVCAYNIMHAGVMYVKEKEKGMQKQQGHTLER